MILRRCPAGPGVGCHGLWWWTRERTPVALAPPVPGGKARGPRPDGVRTHWIRGFTASGRLGLNGSLQQCRLVTLRCSRYAARGAGAGCVAGRPLLGLALDACAPGHCAAPRPGDERRPPAATAGACQAAAVSRISA